MKLNHKDITILVPVYNTDKKCMMAHYNSIKKFPNIKKIYWNDGITCKQTELILYDLIGKTPNVQIFKNQVNKGQEHTVHSLANSEEIDTKYIIRVDVDDTLNCLPEFKESDVDFDILLLGKASKSFELLLKRGGSLNSSIFKTEIFKDLVRDHDKIKEYSKWIHEDVWYALNLFIPIYRNEKKYKITTNIGKQKVTTRGFHRLQQTFSKVSSRAMQRFDTFLVWTMFNRDHELYREMCIKIYGLDDHMKKRKKRIK